MTIDLKSLQSVIAYASIVMGILTTQLAAVHLPPLASAILGIFGILLHPQTSITAPAGTAAPIIGTPAPGPAPAAGSGSGVVSVR